MGKKKRITTRPGIAGVIGAIVAFGITELVHGLYPSVPSIFVSLAQLVVELTPGTLVTQGIELLGKADIPTLITTMLIGTVVVAFLLGNLATRRPLLALAGVAALTALLLREASPRPVVPPTQEEASLTAEPGSAASPIMRSRDAGPDEEITVGRGGFLLLGGGAAVAGLAAASVGRLLGDGTVASATSPKKLNLPEAPTEKQQ